MKHIKPYEQVQCIRKKLATFNKDLKHASKNEIHAVIYCGTLAFLNNETGDAVKHKTVYRCMESYYNISNIIYMHTDSITENYV